MKFNKAFYPFVIALILAMGVFLGFKIQGQNNARNSVYNTKSSSKLEYILRLIDAKYVDTVDNQKLYDDAISKMLNDLDPHSVYLPP